VATVEDSIEFVLF